MPGLIPTLGESAQLCIKDPLNIISRTTVLAMATLAMPLFPGLAYAADTYAADTYVGLSRTTPGEATAYFPNTGRIENYNHPLALKLYGGITFKQRFGVEAGFGYLGTLKVADPTPGSAKEFR